MMVQKALYTDMFRHHKATQRYLQAVHARLKSKWNKLDYI